MVVEEKQISSGLEDKIDALLKAQYPALKEVTGYSTGSGLYTIRNKRFILDKSAPLDVKKLPTVAFCSVSNKNLTNLNVTVDWTDAAEEFEKNRHLGDNIVRGHIYEYGLYNPFHLAAEITIEVRNDTLSLTSWFANGAMINGVSYADAKTAEDLAILKEYDITSLQSAFEGMENLEGIPLLTMRPDVSFYRVDKMFAGCKSLKAIPELPSLSAVTNYTGMFKDCSSLVDASTFSIVKANVTTAEMFSGCTSLTKPPGYVTFSNCSKMFYDCSSLPEEFPVFEVNNTTFKANHTDLFGGNCSVRKATVRVKTSCDVSTFGIDLDSFGANMQEITIIDQNGEVRETLTR